MRGYLKFTLLAILLILSGFSHAISLGEAKIRSYFGSPLDLSIPVSHLGGMTGEDLRIAISALNDNVSGHPLDAMVGSRFQVDYDEASQSVRLRSDAPVMEPYLAFTLNVRWPRGFLKREYTVLLDFPKMAPSPANRVAQSRADQTAQPKFHGTEANQTGTARHAEITPKPTTPAREDIARPSPSQQTLKQQAFAPDNSTTRQISSISEKSRYLVVRGDSLWALAQSLSSEREGSHAQWMATLLVKNPDAFIGGQPHLIKEAYWLTVPANCLDLRLVLGPGGTDFQVLGPGESATSTLTAQSAPDQTKQPAPIEQAQPTAVDQPSANSDAIASAQSTPQNIPPVYTYEGKTFVSDPQATLNQTASPEESTSAPSSPDLSPYELYSLEDGQLNASAEPIQGQPAATPAESDATNIALSATAMLNEKRVAELERQLNKALALIEKQSQQTAQNTNLQTGAIPENTPPALAELTVPAYLFRSMGWLALGMSMVMGYMMYRDRGGPRIQLISRKRKRKDFAAMLERNT